MAIRASVLRRMQFSLSWSARPLQRETPRISPQVARLFSCSGTSCLWNDVLHFSRSTAPHPMAEHVDQLIQANYTLPHPIWSKEELESVEITHEEPETKVDKLAYYCMRSLRVMFDMFAGYSLGKLFGSLDESKWLRRIIFLETVAGVPGMVAAMTRHLQSLRKMRRDHGWIHTLLEEAENERMHLLTALDLKEPSLLFRFCVIASQGMFLSAFWVSYLASPRFCHRFVGYLEEEAVKTYTHCLECIDNGTLKMWANMAAPPIAKKYWHLEDDAMMRDVILVIRADEAHHRMVNHTLSSINPNDNNPYLEPGQKK